MVTKGFSENNAAAFQHAIMGVSRSAMPRFAITVDLATRSHYTSRADGVSIIYNELMFLNDNQDSILLCERRLDWVSDSIR